MPLNILNTHEQTIDWANLHGTFKRNATTRILPIASASATTLDRWRRVGQVFNDVVKHAFASGEPLRPDGSKWSLSNIGQPQKLALSLAAHDVAHGAPTGWISPAYRTRLATSGLTAMLVSGSMKIERLNRVL